MINYNIENFKDLLSAIINQDELESSNLVGVYDTLDSNKLIGLFSNARVCGEMFNTSREVINCNVSRKTKFKNRYIIERIKIKGVE